jgi:hypothetical protein
MVMASFSKCTASSRASARGLLWQLWVAARLDLQRRRHAQIYSDGYSSDEWKTLRVLASIYKSNRLRTAGWISPRSTDSAAARDSSYSTSRRASPRGLGYCYSTTWEATRYRSISGHILQDDPSIREEVLDSRLGGSVPRVLRFFLSGFFGTFLPRLQTDPQPEPTTQPKARGLLHMECDFANRTSISAPASRQRGHF